MEVIGVILIKCFKQFLFSLSCTTLVYLQQFKIGSTQSAHNGPHEYSGTISDAQEALWFAKENSDKASCPKKKRSRDQSVTQTKSAFKSIRDCNPDRTYTKYPSEVDLYQPDESYGDDFNDKPTSATSLRRSRSLAVTREDVFTDLSIPRSGRNLERRSQLIPRARLIEKGSFRDRQTYQHLERSSRLSNSTSVDRLTPSRHPDYYSSSFKYSDRYTDPTRPYPQYLSTSEILHEGYEVVAANSEHNSEQSDSPRNSEEEDEEIRQIECNQKPKSIQKAPGEFDSLDSNYRNKTTSYSSDNCDSEFGLKKYRSDLELSLPNYYPDTDYSLSHDNCSVLDVEYVSNPKEDKEDQSGIDFSYESDHQTSSGEQEVSFEEVVLSPKTYKNTEPEEDIVEEDENIPDSNEIKIHVSGKQQEVTNVEYIKDEFEEIPLEDLSPKQIEVHYIEPEHCKPKIVSTNLKNNSASLDNLADKRKEKNSHAQKSKSFISKSFISRTVFGDLGQRRKSTDVDKLISTEPFVTTHIDNQYFSLPDVTISKSLHKCERIDKKLRQIDKINISKKVSQNKTTPNNSNRFVVNIGNHLDCPTEEPVDFEIQLSSIPPEPEELYGNLNKREDRKFSKPIEIARKCKISTENSEPRNTCPDIKLDTFEDEIKLCSLNGIQKNTDSQNKSSLDFLYEKEFATTEKYLSKTNIREGNIKLHTHKPRSAIVLKNNSLRDKFFGISNKDREDNQKIETKINEEKDINDDKRKLSKEEVIKISKNNKESNSSKETIYTKMPRPQILNIVDARKVRPKSESFIKPIIINEETTKEKGNSAKEYEEKLTSVKDYWTKMLNTTKQKDEEIKKQKEEIYIENKDPDNSESNQNSIIEELRNSPTVENVRKMFEHSSIIPESDKETSPSPSQVEQVRKMFEPIPEIEPESSKMGLFVKESCSFFERAYGSLKNSLNRDQKINSDEKLYESLNHNIEIEGNNSREESKSNEHQTLRKARSFDGNYDEPEFDHIRYKVMKSDLFQKNIFSNCNKNEAQFDGLMQYLQDYSFQELLRNNNVVIIEPVRTKIEPKNNKKCKGIQIKKLDTTRKISVANSMKSTDSQDGKINGVRKHFFYHPIRVNRELIEEELPDPETVRKVRTFFEKEFGECKSPDLSKDPTDQKQNKGRKRLMRYLTVDTTFGKWETASLSSGVSSGGSISDFDSPRPQNNDILYSSEEIICDNGSDTCENHTVSQDVLKKIRECGTSVTYYGGRVVNSQSGPTVSPMTKSIMDEIKTLQRTNDKKNKSAKIDTKTIKPNKADKPNKYSYQGVKFRLVKSNSCSSRLELVGTEKPNVKNIFNESKKKSDVKIIQEIEKLQSINETSNGNSENMNDSVKETVENINRRSSEPINNKKCDKDTKEAAIIITNPVETNTFKKDLDHSFSLRYQDNRGDPFGDMEFEEFQVAEYYHDSLN